MEKVDELRKALEIETAKETLFSNPYLLHIFLFENYEARKEYWFKWRDDPRWKVAWETYKKEGGEPPWLDVDDRTEIARGVALKYFNPEKHAHLIRLAKQWTEKVYKDFTLGFLLMWCWRSWGNPKEFAKETGLSVYITRTKIAPLVQKYGKYFRYFSPKTAWEPLYFYTPDTPTGRVTPGKEWEYPDEYLVHAYHLLPSLNTIKKRARKRKTLY